MKDKIKRVVFATFSPWENGQRLPTNGMIEPMLKFFLSKVDSFTLIDEPHPGSDRVLPVYEIYKNGKLKHKPKPSFLVSWLYPLLILRNSVGTRLPFKIRDFLACIDIFLKLKAKTDLFIGLESVNAIAGIVLKKIGAVKRVIYYVSDYSPIRYKSGWFNNLYLTLDRIAAANADYIWDVSPAMMPARVKAGLNPKYSKKVILVPNALYPEQINYLPTQKTEPLSLVFAGTLGEENGPDIAINSMKTVKSRFPSAKLHIFGGGKTDLIRLSNLTKNLKLENNVIFHGFINDQIKLSNSIKKYRIGLAPYKAIKGSPRWWADATKIRLYLAAGLPVITTQVPPLGKEVEKSKAGLVTIDNPADFSKAVIKILSDKSIFTGMKLAAIKMAKDNIWDNSYSQAFKQMDLELNA